MSRERLRAVSQQLEMERQQYIKIRQEAEDAKAEDERFRILWHAAYPNALRSNKNQFVSEATKNLIGIGALLKDRYWDFCLSESLHDHEDIADRFAFAAEILIHASINDSASVSGYLIDGWDLLGSIISAHQDYMTILTQRSSSEFPHTPPLTQMDLARILDLPRYDINNGVRYKKWIPKMSCNGGRKKHWRHVDPDTQKATLQKIREKCPEILLRNFDSRKGVFA